MLELAGYRVAHANKIALARELAGKSKFDLIISDPGLPDGSGLDLMREIRARQKLPGIALSGFGMETISMPAVRPVSRSISQNLSTGIAFAGVSSG